MNSNLKCFLAFSLGAAGGVAVSWRLLKTKYEQLANDEIKSVIARFSGKVNDSDSSSDDISETKEEPVEEVKGQSIRDYAAVLAKQGYTDYSNTAEENNIGAKSVKEDGPYVISPEEFAEIEEYETVTLTYYADEVLTDDEDEPIEDIEGTVGRESLEHFGDYEDDSVHVRNDELKRDYEILRDLRKYTDVAKRAYKPSPGVEG